jgi:hypothetical protein
MGKTTLNDSLVNKKNIPKIYEMYKTKQKTKNNY